MGARLALRWELAGGAGAGAHGSGRRARLLPGRRARRGRARAEGSLACGCARGAGRHDGGTCGGERARRRLRQHMRRGHMHMHAS